jgi:tetratricopeptide (TPR) repeat protein
MHAFGGALLGLDRHEATGAARILAELTAASPDSALLQGALLDAQEAAHESLPAENTRNAIISRFAKNPDALSRELLARALADDEAKARSVLQQAVRAFPHDPRLLLLDGEFLAANGGGSEAIERLQQFVKVDEQDARAWFVLGRTSIQQGQAQPAVDDYLVRALVLNTRARDLAAEAETRNALGAGYERLGQLDASKEQYARAASMRDQLGDRIGLSKSLRNLAIVQAELGERDIAEKTLDRVRTILEELGDRASLADLHNDRGVIAEERGDFAAALAAYRAGLAVRQQLDLPDQVAESLNNVAFASFQLGQFDNALVYWQQAAALYRKLDDGNGTLRIEQSIGLLDIARGHFAAAREGLQASLRRAEDRQLTEEAAAGHLNLATLSLAEGRYVDAIDHAERARQLAARRSDLRIATEGSLLKARAANALGDDGGVDAALATVDIAQINSEQRAMFLLAEAQRAQAGGDYALATTKLEEATRAATQAHSGKVGLEIQLQRVRLALVDGNRPRVPKLLDAIRADATHLGEVPMRLEWLELEMVVALNGGDRGGAIRHYREALPLLKDIGRWADALFLHRLAALAYPAASADAAAARSAADAARAQLLADVPIEARARFDRRMDLRLQAEAGHADAQ